MIQNPHGATYLLPSHAPNYRFWSEILRSSKFDENVFFVQDVTAIAFRASFLVGSVSVVPRTDGGV